MTSQHTNIDPGTSHTDPLSTREDDHRGTAAKARESFDRRMSDVQHRAEAATREIDRAVRTSTEEGTRFVRENPGIALAGAVGLGMLIGLSLGAGRR